MSGSSSIEWTDATWGPTLGCVKVSAGCEHCYAIRTVYRQEHAFKRTDYAGLTRKLPDGSLNWTGKVNLLPSRLKLDLGPCWVWTGYINEKNGYAYFWFEGKPRLAHVLAYAWADGEQVRDWPRSGLIDHDHLCRNRGCVRRSHLERATHQENVLRGDGLAARAARQSTCRNGHPFDSHDGRQRRCRTCHASTCRRSRGRVA